MRLQATVPTGHAQSFEINETFFSTTDARGVITAGNGVFCRISGYASADMIGQPHNLIRHPDMPRQVFRQLWRAIKSGRPFMGYVKNQARNGNHYWVFAVVLPIGDRFLSVRIKPTSRILTDVEALYRRMAQAEADAIASGAAESVAADASEAVLAEGVATLGFSSYAAFSHAALNSEIKSRDLEVARRSLRLFPCQLRDDGRQIAGDVLAILYRQTLTAYEGIKCLFDSLDGFTTVCTGIHERKDAIQNIADDFRLNALNAHIAAHPLGSLGLTLGTVAQILSGHAQNLASSASRLADHIIETTTAVTKIASNLSAARIVIEMLLAYLVELARGEHAAADIHRLRAVTEDLRAAFTGTVEEAFRAVDTLRHHLRSVLAAKKQLRKDIIFLRVAQISGLTEATRLREADGMLNTFIGLRDQVDSGTKVLEELDNIVDQLKTLADATPPTVHAIRISTEHIRETLALAGNRVARGGALSLDAAPIPSDVASAVDLASAAPALATG